MNHFEAIEKIDVESIEAYLKEDLGSGDLTALIVPKERLAKASLITREPMVLCGKAWFEAVFARLDPQIKIDWKAAEGSEIPANTQLCELQGPARGLLTGERTALNLLQTLSGTATLAKRYAKAVEGTQVKVLDTRKTLPGLRLAQKYAVRCGGCHNHRIGLYDGILIKENHILSAGSIHEAVQKAKSLNANVPIEVEVENLDELQQALNAGAARMMLDNFDLDHMKQAVALVAKRAELEVSGNVTLQNIKEIAETGVDFISVGDLTKNLTSIDLSMRIMLD